MLRGWAPALAVVVIAGSGEGDAAARKPAEPRVAVGAVKGIITEPRVSLKRWPHGLAPIDVRNRNTGARAKIRLYEDDGGLSAEALRRFMRVAATDAAIDGDEPLEPRVIMLAIRASYHFGGAPIVIVSATRKGSSGYHGTGDALDFQLEKVDARKLAAYLFGTPRAGVGLYTHPKTQYAHLDARARSYHWLDASPPGVTWRESLLRDPKQAQRDAGYVPASDLPEAALE
jgi:uncharacterized protein YcbK (DUF882 family)